MVLLKTNTKDNKTLKFVFLILLTILISLTFHPIVQNTTKDTLLHNYLLITFTVFFLISINLRALIKVAFIKWYLTLLVLSFIVLFIGYAIGYPIAVLSDLRSLSIPLMALIIGYELNLSTRHYYITLVTYLIIVLFAGLSQILLNIGSFSIVSHYAIKLKNILGIALGTAAIITTLFALSKEKRSSIRLIYACLTILYLIFLLTIRARATSAVTIAILIFLLFRSINKKNLIIAISGLILIASVTAFLLPENSKRFIYQSFTLGVEDDITSDRFTRNVSALKTITEHPFLGNLEKQDTKIGWVHNYFLLKLFEYGFLFGFPLLILYLFLFKTAVKNVFNEELFKIQFSGYTLMLLPFGLSLVEPTLPYGPGTTTVINFIFWGVALRNSTTSSTIMINK